MVFNELLIKENNQFRASGHITPLCQLFAFNSTSWSVLLPNIWVTAKPWILFYLSLQVRKKSWTLDYFLFFPPNKTVIQNSKYFPVWLASSARVTQWFYLMQHSHQTDSLPQGPQKHSLCNEAWRTRAEPISGGDLTSPLLLSHKPCVCPHKASVSCVSSKSLCVSSQIVCPHSVCPVCPHKVCVSCVSLQSVCVLCVSSQNLVCVVCVLTKFLCILTKFVCVPCLCPPTVCVCVLCVSLQSMCVSCVLSVCLCPACVLTNRVSCVCPHKVCVCLHGLILL